MRGRVSQPELHAAMGRARVWSYPTAFPETSCIGAMEARAAGLALVTSDVAALSETVGSDHGILIPIDETLLRTEENQPWSRRRTVRSVPGSLRRRGLRLLVVRTPGRTSMPAPSGVEGDWNRRADGGSIYRFRTPRVLPGPREPYFSSGRPCRKQASGGWISGRNVNSAGFTGSRLGVPSLSVRLASARPRPSGRVPRRPA
jgi:hypothetical protein